MASDTDEEYEDLREYFTAAGWKELSNYEKLRLQNIKRNYQMMVEIGLTVAMPDFMVQKRKKTTKRSHSTSSDEDDEEWLPFKKSTSHPGTSSAKHSMKKHKTMKRVSSKLKNKSSNDVSKRNTVKGEKKQSYCGKRKLIREGKKGKKKPKVPERSYPKRKNALKCYKEETVPDDDHFIYCEDCQEFYQTGCPQHPLTIVEDTPVPTRGKNYCRQSLPSGLSIKETTIFGAGLGVFAEKNFEQGVRFGPYKGKLVGELDAFSSGYAWEICAKGKPSHYVDAKSEYTSNWMRFVNCARNEKEQNLVAFQYLGQIYYRTFKPIPAGSELLVYYGKDYAKDLGIEMVPLSANAREIQQRKVKDEKSSYRCEECGNLYTIHIYLLKHLKYSHGKPIYFPRTVERSFHSPVMLPRRVGQGVTNADQIHQVPVSDRDQSLGKSTSMNGHIGIGLPVVTETESQLMVDNKVHDDRCLIKKNLFKAKKQNCDTLSTKETQPNSEACMLHHATDTRLTKGSMTTSETELCEHKAQYQLLTGGDDVGKFLNFGQSGAVVSRCMTEHAGLRVFQCKTCGTSFSCASQLQTHERIHSGEKPYQCKTCGKSFNQEGNLKTHERIHSGEKPYQCKICGKSFNQTCDLKRHERIHSGEKPFQCKTCEKSFNQESHLKTHERIHSGEKPYQCKTCGKSFNQTCDLKTHERIHSGEKPYQCKTCGKSFNRAGVLKTHERIHSGEKPYQCKTCGKSFNRAGVLKRHERIHSGEKPYQCKTCGKSFIQEGHLKTHERIHSGEKPYQCKTCGKSFIQEGHLKRHKRIHSGEKPYQCKTCGKSFNRAGVLKRHERIHSGEKPYQCKTCGKSFNRAGVLKRHERIHSGEKPYQCKTCGKSFIQEGHLKTHERIHSGEKLYQCKTCGKLFSDASNCKKHERSHSEEHNSQVGSPSTQGNGLKGYEREHSRSKSHDRIFPISRQPSSFCEE